MIRHDVTKQRRNIVTTGKRHKMAEDIATIFKNNLKCKFVSSITFSSFELIFTGGFSHPILCAVIYQPLKCNSKIINDICDILTSRTKCDRTLIIGDFNIHVYCTPKSLTFFRFGQCFFLACRHGQDNLLKFKSSIRMQKEKGNVSDFEDGMVVCARLSLKTICMVYRG